MLCVEPQATEQPLDAEGPENEMMLAIYLTALKSKTMEGRLIPFTA
jgi:hypothetical protein